MDAEKAFQLEGESQTWHREYQIVTNKLDKEVGRKCFTQRLAKMRNMLETVMREKGREGYVVGEVEESNRGFRNEGHSFPSAVKKPSAPLNNLSNWSSETLDTSMDEVTNQLSTKSSPSAAKHPYSVLCFCSALQQAMAETFYLSNIVPQNYENNAGFWNRLEMYCRELTHRYENVWVISGPLTLPRSGTDGKKTVSYQVIGKNEVAVPTHLYKVILAQKSSAPSALMALGAFVVPNKPIGFDHQLPEYQVDLRDLEKMSGITFFPALDKSRQCRDLCATDTCKLLSFAEFNRYIAGRKVQNARTLHTLEKVMAKLQESGIEPDEYLQNLYQKKKQEVEVKEASEGRAAKGA
ncbi:nuclease EXOG, mitochondrial-like [Scyliorhinus canicula]|uniref:nuclease EXOG, mitochondrial-like n=1 Tax=Scyliorhinus canicula TaxID=7830 RepID=UPI0018F4538C|nr:nuclease EXOG, mitochondrial-like [Scyliorhinus canicula]